MRLVGDKVADKSATKERLELVTDPLHLSKFFGQKYVINKSQTFFSAQKFL